MFTSSPGFKKYAFNTGYMFFEKIIRVIFTFFIWTLVIRYLGPEQFGILSYALSFVFLFSVLSDLGLDAVSVKELVRHPQKNNELLGGIFILRLLGGVVAFGLIILVTNFLALDNLTRAVTYILSLRLIFQAALTIDFYFQARILSQYVVYSQIFSLFFTGFLYILFIFYKKPVTYFAFGLVLESMITAIGLAFFYSKRAGKLSNWTYRWTTVKHLFRESWPLAMSGVASSIYMRIDQIMIKDLLNVHSVGQFSAALRISEAVYFIPLILASSLFPAIINAKQNDERLYQKRLRMLFSVLVWIALGLSVLFTVISYPLVKILLGDAFLPAAQVLCIHVWGSVFVFLGVARTKWAINENLQIYTMIYLILGAVLNVTLNFFLIPRMGINGAAIASVAAQCFAAVLCNVLHKKTRPLLLLQIQALNPFYTFKQA